LILNTDFVDYIKKAEADYGNWEKIDSRNIHFGKNRYGYVYGAQGQVWTKELALEFARTGSKPDAYYLIECDQWLGRRVVDCSGMVIEGYRHFIPKYPDQTANGLISRCTETGDMAVLPEIQGVCVWKPSHIGIYIGDGMVVESRGTDYGVVISPLGTQPWQKWGFLQEIQYETAETAFILTRKLELIMPRMQGQDVTDVQKALRRAGYPKENEWIMGSYDVKTVDAVKKFQKAKKLTVDGIVEEKTCEALNGKWAPTADTDFTLGRILKLTTPRMQGSDVTDVQNALKRAGYPKKNDWIVGSYDLKTVDAVKKFQKAKDLLVDGIVGKNTCIALNGEWTGK